MNEQLLKTSGDDVLSSRKKRRKTSLYVRGLIQLNKPPVNFKRKNNNIFFHANIRTLGHFICVFAFCNFLQEFSLSKNNNFYELSKSWDPIEKRSYG